MPVFGWYSAFASWGIALAVPYGDGALQMAEAGARPYERLSVYIRVGELQVRQGTLPQAILLLERAVALSQDANIPFWYRVAARWLALAYALAGRATDVLPSLAMGQVGENPIICGEAYLHAGDVGGSPPRPAGARKLPSTQKAGRGGAGPVAARRDCYASCPPDVASAEVHYQQALVLAEALGMRPLQARCHHEQGTLYGQIGRGEQARTVLAVAIALYLIMEMICWLPQAEAVLAQVA